MFHKCLFHTTSVLSKKFNIIHNAHSIHSKIPLYHEYKNRPTIFIELSKTNTLAKAHCARRQRSSTCQLCSHSSVHINAVGVRLILMREGASRILVALLFVLSVYTAAATVTALVPYYDASCGTYRGKIFFSFSPTSAILLSNSNFAIVCLPTVGNNSGALVDTHGVVKTARGKK